MRAAKRKDGEREITSRKTGYFAKWRCQRFQQKRQPSQENCQLFSVRKSTFSVTIYSLFTIHVDILVFEFLKEEKFNIYNIYIIYIKKIIMNNFYFLPVSSSSFSENVNVHMNNEF